jgi:PBSX family phage terminase large subunit
MSLMPETFFKQLLNRLSVTGAKLYATTNPDTPSHYLYTDYIINTEKQKSGLIDVITYGLDDNPSLDDEYKKYIRQAYQGVWHLRMILGKWVSAEGAIFDMWGEKENMYDEMPLGLKSLCRRNISIDYGTTNPMIFCDFFDDGNNIWLDRLYCWDSRKKNRQKTDSQYADDLIEFIGDERPDYIIIDPSAASFKAELHQRGLRIKDADNEVLDGLRMMATLIAQRRLKVNRQCKEFKTEIEGYVWDEKARKLGKEQPLKEGDHVMDACRYFVKTMLRAWRLGK